MIPNISRRHLLVRASALPLATQPLYAPSHTWAQGFPSKPVTLIVGFSAGGPADVISRIVARELEPVLGQPVIVDNKPGASGKIAMQALLRAPRDGHTLAYISPSILSIAPLLDKDLGFDTARDVMPLTTVVRSSNLVAIHPSVPARNLQQLAAYARNHPGRLNYGSIGTGSWFHLAMEKLLTGLGIEATHVPYKGEAPALTDLAAGNIQMMIVSVVAKPFLEDGKIVGLAATGAKPALYSDAPTVQRSGIASLKDYDETPWVGFGMATGVAPAISEQIHAALTHAIRSPGVQAKLASMGDIQTSTSQELKDAIARELADNRKLIDSGRVKLN